MHALARIAAFLCEFHPRRGRAACDRWGLLVRAHQVEARYEREGLKLPRLSVSAWGLTLNQTRMEVGR